MKSQSVLFRNDLLESFHNRVRERLISAGKRIELEVDEDLTFSSGLKDYAYFPAGCIIHLVDEFADDCGTEVLMVGRESFCGTSLFPIADALGTRAVVIRDGPAVRVPAAALVEEFNRSELTRWTIMQAIHESHMQTARTATFSACFHMAQMLSRWLVMFSERARSLEIKITQDRIARALGVRRESVSHTLNQLQDQGVLECGRGRILIRDPDALILSQYAGSPSQSAGVGAGSSRGAD